MTDKPLTDYFGYFLRDNLDIILEKMIRTTIIFDGSLDDMKRKYGQLLKIKRNQLVEAMTKGILEIYIPQQLHNKEKIYHFVVFDRKDLLLEELHESYSPRRIAFIGNTRKLAIYHELIFEELLDDCYLLTIEDLKV